MNDIPIYINEALPSNVLTGWNRSGEVVRLGVPLRDSDKITSVSQLKMSGATEYQLSTFIDPYTSQADRYPSGNLRWVVIDALVSTTANTEKIIYLQMGSPSIGANLATSDSSKISINTGAMYVEVSKTTGNILDLVQIGATTFVESGNTGGIYLTDYQGTIFSSYYDTTSKNLSVTLEENGPIHVIVRVDGFLWKSSGSTPSTDTKMRFEARLHFYKNKKYIDVNIITKNDSSIQNYRAQRLTGIDFVVKTNLTSSASVVLEGSAGTVSTTLNSSIYSIQGFSTFRQDPTLPTYAMPQLIDDSTQAGYYIKQDTTVLQDFSTSAAYAKGYAKISEGSKYFSMIFRQMSGWPASGFNLGTDGTYEFNIYSKFKVASDPKYRYSFFAHESREFSLCFDTSAIDAALEENRVNYPLFGVCSLEQFRNTGAYYYNYRIPTKTEEINFYRDPNGGNIPTYDILDLSETTPQYSGVELPSVGVVRYGSSSTGGPEGNIPYPTTLMIKYLQTRMGCYFLLAEARNNAIALSSSVNAHDFDAAHYMIYHANPSDVTQASWVDDGGVSAYTCNGTGGGYKSFIENAHPHWLSFPIWCRLRGDSRRALYVEGIVATRDWGMYWFYGNTLVPYANIGSATNLRSFSYSHREVTVKQYMGATDSKFINSWDQITTAVSDPDNLLKAGWDNDRGFFTDANGNDVDNSVIHSFFLYDKYAENLDIMETLGNKIPSSYFGGDTSKITYLHKIRDHLMGLSLFVNTEVIPLKPSDTRTWYDYPMYTTPDIDEITNETNVISSDFDLIMAYGYEQTALADFIDIGRLIQRQITLSNSGNEPYHHTLSALRMAYDWTYRNNIQVGFSTLNVIENGGGSYTIIWNRPSVAVYEYVIKWSSKTIVLNLNFNNQTREYQYDPATYISFWAADEPVTNPGIYDTTITLTGLPTGLNSSNFMLRYRNQFAVNGRLENDAGPSSTARFVSTNKLRITKKLKVV